jgi:hypothetical protein
MKRESRDRCTGEASPPTQARYGFERRTADGKNKMDGLVAVAIEVHWWKRIRPRGGDIDHQAYTAPTKA